MIDGRLEEFSSLPSAKLTVDEFREIWFQNSADPPSFAKPRTALMDVEEDSDEETDETPAIEDSETTQPPPPEIEGPDTQAESNEQLANKEAESAFLEDLVQDKELEDEIQRHLDKDQFQQALAEMAGNILFIYISLCILTIELNQQATNAPVDEGSLSDLDDDDEVAGAIIDDTSENFILRAQLWMESNREYLREQRGTTTHPFHPFFQGYSCPISVIAFPSH
jgi:transcription factor IIIB 90 kDa subunit